MAERGRTLKITILGDPDSAKRAVQSVDGALGKLGNATQKIAIGIAAFGAAVGAAGAVAGTHLFNVSRELQAMDSKAKTVFGDQIGVIQRWADANASALGTSTQRLVGLGAATADLLIPMGFQRDQATALTQKTLELSGALSEWSSGQYSAAEVSEILTKAYLGERDQLKSLGVAISEADLQARLAAKGQADLTGQALEQAKALATLELITEKSTDAQAQFAAGGPPIARAQAVIQSAITQVRDTLAERLTPAFAVAAQWLAEKIPIATDYLLGKMDELQGWFEDHREQIVGFFDTVRGAAVTMFGYFKSGLEVVLPLLVGFGKWIVDNKPVLIAAVAALGVGVLAVLGPVGAIAVGLVALTTAIGYFRDNWGSIWAHVQQFAIDAAVRILDVIEELGKGFALIEKPLEFLSGGTLDIPSVEQSLRGLRLNLEGLDPVADYERRRAEQEAAELRAAAAEAEADALAAERDATSAKNANTDATDDQTLSLADLTIETDGAVASTKGLTSSTKETADALEETAEAADALAEALKRREEVENAALRFIPSLPGEVQQSLALGDLIASFTGTGEFAGQGAALDQYDTLLQLVYNTDASYQNLGGTGANLSTAALRQAYESGQINSAQEFATVLGNLLQSGANISGDRLVVELSDDLQIQGAP